MTTLKGSAHWKQKRFREFVKNWYILSFILVTPLISQGEVTQKARVHYHVSCKDSCNQRGLEEGTVPMIWAVGEPTCELEERD